MALVRVQREREPKFVSQNCWSSFIGSFLFSNKNVGLLLLDQTVAFFYFLVKGQTVALYLLFCHVG